MKGPGLSRGKGLRSISTKAHRPRKRGGVSSARRSGVSKDMQTLIRGPVLGKSGGKRLAKGLCPEGKQDPPRAYSWGNDVLGARI